MSSPTNQELSDIRIRLTEYIRTTSENIARLDNRLTKIEAYLSYLSENLASKQQVSSTKISDKVSPSTIGEVDNLDRIETKVDKLSKDYLKNIKELNALINSLRKDLKKILPHVSEKDKKKEQSVLKQLGISKEKW